MLRFYSYRSCDSCRKAKKWLKDQGLEFTEIPIREQPPSKCELAQMRAARGNLKALFSTSGGDYRSMNLAAKVDSMSDDDAFDLMSENGNLVKRPFLIGNGIALQGFRLAEWEAALDQSD